MNKLVWYLTTLFILVFAFTFCAEKQKPITPETALQSYLHNGDKTFQWEVTDSFNLGAIQGYQLQLTSQQWREHTWTHQLTVLVPEENQYDGALLFITGGSNENGQPNWTGNEDKFMQSMGKLASKNKAMVSILRQVPNQPLYDSLKEDALISFTLHNFKNDGDYTWPLLFPMVKSAVRTMDALQEFAKEKLNHDIARFVVSGASKRGWTTWLTGASDARVVAIAPMVIDVLNMPVSLDYQIKVWKEYSIQIEDYVKLGIPQDVHSEEGDALTKMIDPYAYRDKLTMPKMIFIGTNDEYWPVDAIKNYLDSIPGKNFVHYVPNVGHDLGDKKQALEALSAFFGATMMKREYPVCSWDITENDEEATLSVKATPDALLDAVLWTADSEDRDFRDDHFVGKSLGINHQDAIVAREALPDSGFRAFYLDLKYADPNGGTYTESTRMFVADNDEIFIK